MEAGLFFFLGSFALETPNFHLGGSERNHVCESWRRLVYFRMDCMIFFWLGRDGGACRRIARPESAFMELSLVVGEARPFGHADSRPSLRHSSNFHSTILRAIGISLRRRLAFL